MSIDEAVAVKAVQDGLAGRNVPIVHKEIRVVLAMALERDALKARVETAERDLDIARGLIARLGDPDSLESLWVLLRYERLRVAELERVQDAAFRDAHRAEADAARLREALTQVRDAMLATGQGPDGDDDPRRPVAAAVWRALASAPSADPTPRDMRVAEAVWEAERLRCLRVGSAFINMMSPREPFGCADMSRFARAERDTPTIDLAAVVAKAVGT